MPSARDFHEARERHHAAQVGWKPGTVLLGGIEYRAAVKLRDRSFVLGERGASKVQMVYASIAKALLPDPPEQGQIMTIDGRAFKIVEVGGDDATSATWHLSGSRTPGADGH